MVTIRVAEPEEVQQATIRYHDYVEAIIAHAGAAVVIDDLPVAANQFIFRLRKALRRAGVAATARTLRGKNAVVVLPK
jgi:hypothetical protein